MSVPTRAERQAETRRRMLEAAAEVFARRGFHGASVAEIATTAGFTTGALYSNFGGKEELFVALIDEHLTAYREDTNALSETPDPGSIAQAATDRVSDVVKRMGSCDEESVLTAAGGRLTAKEMMMLSLEFLLFVIRERPDLHISLRTRWEEADQQMAAVFERLRTSGGHRQGSLDPHDAAFAQACFVEGLGLRLLYDPNVIEPDRAARLHVETVLRAAGWGA